MSSTPSSIKHANHRVYPVIQEKKIELITTLLSQNTKHAIVILSADKAAFLKENLTQTNVAILQDDELDTLANTSYDLLISYDLPKEAETYWKRLALTKDKAVILLNEKEQNGLYPLEILLGRAIKQEILAGYGYPIKEELKKEFKQKPQPKSPEKKVYEKKPYEGSDKPKKEYKPFTGEKKSFNNKDKTSKDGEYKSSKKPYDKSGQSDKRKKENKFLGKDENGKAIFSGKSGERNHRYDGKPKDFTDISSQQPKKPGKTINIKALKKKPEEK